jgi:hypothetical protein
VSFLSLRIIRILNLQPILPVILVNSALSLRNNSLEMDGKWHASVEQKIPLNTEHDNVTPGYLRNLHAIVLEAMVDHITSEDAVKPWARAAVEAGKLSEETVKKVVAARFGDKFRKSLPWGSWSAAV